MAIEKNPHTGIHEKYIETDWIGLLELKNAINELNEETIKNVCFHVSLESGVFSLITRSHRCPIMHFNEDFNGYHKETCGENSVEPFIE